MGFLDHSTNNIIVDAVLTDYGRQKLANQGSTATQLITEYAFADDEVDYSVITKYGVIVGKEKIEKNTPIFEASTNARYNASSFLVSSPNANGQQPAQSAEFIGGNELSLNNNVISMELSTTNPNSNLSGISYTIEYDSRFITLSGDSVQIGSTTGTRTRSTVDSINGLSSTVKLTLVGDGASKIENGTRGSTSLKVTNSVTSEQTIKNVNLNYASN